MEEGLVSKLQLNENLLIYIFKTHTVITFINNVYKYMLLTHIHSHFIVVREVSSSLGTPNMECG